RVLLTVDAEPVVDRRIGGLQFDLVDQFPPLGSGPSGGGELAPAAFRQQEVLDRGGVVGRQLQGPSEGGEHLGPTVELGEDQQATEVNAGLDGPALELEM